MNVYVARVCFTYPNIDGDSWTIGVYSSKEKAEEALEDARPKIEEYLAGAIDMNDTYNLVIEEFELQ